MPMQDRANKEVVILVGNIGSGKSTIVKKYVEKDYLCICRDSLRYMIGGGKYIFNKATEPFVKHSNLAILEEALQRNFNTIVDEVNYTKRIRSDYIQLAKLYNYKVTVVLFPILSQKECVDRRMTNPHGQPNRHVWENIWEMFNNAYEVPSKEEGIDKIIRLKRSTINS